MKVKAVEAGSVLAGGDGAGQAKAGGRQGG